MAQTKTNKTKSKTKSKDIAQENAPKKRGRPPGSGKKK
jgi:hypothetical protein